MGMHIRVLYKKKHHDKRNNEKISQNNFEIERFQVVGVV